MKNDHVIKPRNPLEGDDVQMLVIDNYDPKKFDEQEVPHQRALIIAMIQDPDHRDQALEFLAQRDRALVKQALADWS